MFLTREQIQERIDRSEHPIIENLEPENLGKFSYDLRVEKIIIPSEEGQDPKDHHTLAPGCTVFVSTIENLRMPNDLIGIVTQKNSVIRRGLQIDAPIYHPGHHTKIFLRVTNISQDDIVINHNSQIASIMFGSLGNEVEPYDGHFVDEFDYRGVANYPHEIPQASKVDKKIKDIEHLENSIYEKVILIVTIFIGIFSLINLNITFLENADLLQMVIYNLISIGGIGIFVSFIGLILNNQNKRKWVILGISILMIVVGIILMMCNK